MAVEVRVLIFVSEQLLVLGRLEKVSRMDVWIEKIEQLPNRNSCWKVSSPIKLPMSIIDLVRIIDFGTWGIIGKVLTKVPV